MVLSRQSPRRSAIAVALLMAPVAAALLAVSIEACSGPGNTGQSTIDASLIEAVPWTNGGVPIRDDSGQPIIPAAPTYPPIASGILDPGSGPVDCTVLEGIQTSPGFYDTFEPPSATDAGAVEGGVGVAIAWTGYDDLSWGSFHVPGDITWYAASPAPPSGCVEPRCDPGSSLWGLAAYPMGGPSCGAGANANQWSLHFRGGLFRNWGGGASSVFTDPRGICEPDADICPHPWAPGAKLDSAGLPTGLPDGGDYLQSHAFVDASAYDGVAFWARTGPEGQTAMIVTITDNFTSDRLARQNQKFCRRLKQCYTQCSSGAPCTPTVADPLQGTIYRCFDPASGPFPGSAASAAAGTGVPALTELLYPRCGQSACSSPSTYLDPDFDGKACHPYTFPAADYSAEYCWNAGDPPPPSREEQCLDGWAAAVDLTLDWHYFTVPWSSMHQGGFGKQAPYFNTKAIDTIAFGFIDGWADVYVDNVSFYRRTR